MVFQLGSALLDACVLAILQKEDAYGYKLTQEAKKSNECFRINIISCTSQIDEGGVSGNI